MEKPIISSDVIRGHIDTIILYTLISGDKFAQQISDEIAIKSENQYEINQATLYSSLKRLENTKLLSSYWNDAEEGRRKYFKITQSGIDSVNSNIESWTNSKNIIDKLTDCEPEYKNTLFFATHKDSEKHIVKPIENSVSKNSVVIENDTQNKTAVNPNENQSETLNFRAVLDSIVKANVIREQKEAKSPIDDISDVDESDVLDNKDDNEINFEELKTNNDGRIDYSDISKLAIENGFKMRISSKDSCKQIGTLKFKALSFVSLLLVFVISMIECGISALIVDSSPTKFFSFDIMLGLSCFTLLVGFISYLFKGRSLIDKQLTNDRLSNSFIVFVNLSLITIALVFFANVKITETSYFIMYFALPILYYFNIFLYFVFEKKLYKSRRFHIKKS